MLGFPIQHFNTIVVHSQMHERWVGDFFHLAKLLGLLVKNVIRSVSIKIKNLEKAYKLANKTLLLCPNVSNQYILI